jgi:hypothetical protein
MTRSVESEECTNPHPLYLQSSAFRVKRQAVVGTFLVLGLVAAVELDLLGHAACRPLSGPGRQRPDLTGA